MKKLFFLFLQLHFAFCILYFSSLPLKAQYCNPWNTITNYPTADLSALKFVSKDTAFALSGYYNVIKTTDGGASWISLSTGIPSDYFLSSASFVNSKVGYLGASYGRILKTTNGGNNWTILNTISGQLINALNFINADTGYVVTDYGGILKTNDGGVSWTSQGTYGNSYDFRTISFVNDSTGFILASYAPDGRTMLKTTNGGETWIILNKTFSNLNNAFYFRNADTGYFADNSAGIFYKTTDGGANWTILSSGITTSISSFYYKTSDTAFATTYNGIILKTVNGGANWITQTTNVINELNSIGFNDANNGFVIGNSGTMLKTTDGGNTWLSTKIGTNKCLNSMFFIDSTHFYVVGGNGVIRKTEDGGQSWIQQNSGTSNSLFSIFFTSPDTGYAVGANYTLIKTTNGGANWTAQTTSVYQYFKLVYFIDANTGFITCGNGDLLKTTNGGTNWTNQYFSGYCINSMFFRNHNVGYAVGNGGTIMKTTNAGQNWSTITSITSKNLYKVYFANDSIGYATGANGTILKTTDGGNTWIVKSSNINITNTINSTYFSDANTGFVVCSGGLIKKTTDGAISWATQLSNTTKDLYDINFANSNVAYIVGDTALILKTINKGDAIIGQAITPIGFRQRCISSEIATYKINKIQNATSYVWSLSPSTAGTISGTDTVATVSWNPVFSGQANINVYGTNGICSGLSSALYVYTDTTQTSAFGLASPSNGAYTSKTPLLSWYTTTGSNYYYRLYIDGVFKTENSIYALSYQFQSGEALSPGIHTWYVTAGGCQVHSNETWSILVDTTSPTVFGLISPVNNSWSTNLTPTFNWESSTDVNSGIYFYKLLIDGIYSGLTYSTTSVTSSRSLAQGVHSWMVQASDNVGNIRNSAQTYTLKIDNQAPTINTLLTPDSLKYLAVNTPYFSWTASIDLGIGLLKYQLYIDNTLNKDNLSSLNYTITSPLTYGSHTWYVKSFDSLGNNQSTAARTFYIDNAKPNAFNLTSPANNQVVSLPTPNFTWQSATDSTGGSGIRKYQLWINGVISRDSVPYYQTTSAPGNALPQGTHTWFVNVFDKAGNVRQSNETRTFIVDWEPPTAFNLIEPINNETSMVSRPQFKWHSSSDAAGLLRYELCISGQAPVIILPTDTNKLLTFDLPNNTYTWYVKAYDIAGTFTSSNTYTLTVNVPLPNQAIKPTGTNALCINPSNMDYSTIAINYATSYIWEITPSNAGTIIGSGLSATVDWNNTFSGIAQIRVKGHNSIGDGLFSDPITVKISPVTIAGSVSGNGNICQGTSTGMLTLSGYTGSIIKWQKKSEDGIWTDISDTTEYYSEIVAIAGNWIYRAQIQSGVCSLKVSDSAIVIVDPIPVAMGAITGLSSVCKGQTSVTYNVLPFANVMPCIWTLPFGASGSSSTNSIIVDYGSSAVSGNISVRVHNSCGDGNSSTLAVTVNAIPTITGTISDTLCGAGIVTLEATTTSGTINWYSDLTADSSLHSGTSYYPSILQTTTFYADVTNNGCTSYPRTAVTAIIKPIPVITSTTSDSTCGAGIVLLRATASSGIIHWYLDPLTTTSVGNGNTYSPYISSTTNYYVDATDNLCITPNRMLIRASMNNLPIVNANATTTAVCEGSPLTLSGSGTIDVNYTWNNGVINGVSFNPINTNTYTVTGTTIYGCQQTASITVSVNPSPAVNPINGTTVLCEGTLNSAYNVVLHTYGQPLPPSGGHGTVTDQADAASYNYLWSYNGNAIIIPATTVNAITANFIPGTTSGILSVVETDPTTGCYHTNTLAITVIPPPQVSTFTAAVSNAWEKCENWDQGIPGPLTNATIPSNKLAIVNSNNYLCKSLIIEPKAKLTINTTKDLTVNDTLILQSDSTGTASLIENGTLHTTTNIVERYISHTFTDEFHMLASPVAIQAISPSFNEINGFFLWNELTSNWINYSDSINFTTSNNGTNFIPGKGYAVSYPAVVTKTFTGNLNTGTINIPLTYTAGLYSGWNFIANPYPSAINWNAINGWTRNALLDAGNGEKAMWIWNPTAANYGAYISNEAMGTNNVSRTIPSAQGFWVKAIQSGNLSMTNEIREHADQLFLKSTSSIPDMLRLSVNGTANSYSDELIIKFRNMNDKGGAEKMFSMDASAPGIYSTKLNKNWSINMLTSVAEHSVIPVGFKAGANGNYTITVSDLNSFSSPTYTYLKDLKTNILTDLNQNTTYSFTATTNDNANRFQLLFAASPLSVSNTILHQISIYAYDNSIYINSNETIQQIRIYNTLGQLIKTVGNTNGKAIVNMKNFAASYYIVRVVTTKNVYSEKVFVK